jgi:hypothetical protein
MAENTKADGAKALLDVAFSHPIKIIANALGVHLTGWCKWEKTMM